MSLSTDQIENQAESHRANISELIDELRNRVTPGEVMDQFLGWGEGHEIARNFGRQVTNNPLPLALIGTGVAWLMFSDGTRRRNGGNASASAGSGIRNGAAETTESVSDEIARVGESVASATDYAKATASGAGSKIKDTASQVSDAAASALEYGRQTASDIANTAQSAYARTKETVNVASDSVTASATSVWQKTTDFTQSAKDTMKETGSSIGRMAQEQPLLVAGLGFVIGMALGAVLPTTEAEDSLLGEQSDAVKEKAGELAGEGYEKAKAVAERGYEAATEAAKDEARNQGLTEEKSESATDAPPAQGSSSADETQPNSSNSGGDYGGYVHH